MSFSEKIINWYQLNKRNLPWRETTNPYIIWLSEIILQQTRVNQGLAYFNAFIENYPTIEHLANAKEEDVLKLWQGLGYYSRARNLHFTAKHIVKEHNGVFPTTHKEVLGLKGVGEYTAAAITSFAYGLPYPVVDGNVYRVLSRCFGVETPIDSVKGKKQFKELANDLMDCNHPNIYNQAIMEFGALQCTPKNPDCENCPLHLECYALKNNAIANLPIKTNKIKQRNRYFNYLVFVHNNTILLNKRTAKDIWNGLYDFPLIESDQAIHDFKQLKTSFNDNSLTFHKKTIAPKHLLSHQKIYATFWKVSTKNIKNIDARFIQTPLKEINNFPVPKLVDNYLKLIV